MAGHHDIRECLSALMDGQASEAEAAHVLERLEQEPELAKAWERYHLIRAVLNRGLGPVLVNGLSERVAHEISRLPAPPDVSRWRSNRRAAARWAGGLALAASLAGLTILGVRWLVPTEQLGDPGPLVVGVSAPAEVVRAGVTRWEPGEPEIADLLNTYLVQHNEISPAANMQGVMSYGRFVGYDNSP